jgi:hypothetical protein
MGDPVFAYSEGHAYRKWHIRPLTTQGIRLHGTPDTPALCGLQVLFDVNHEFPGNIYWSPEHVCSQCHAAHQRMLQP